MEISEKEFIKETECFRFKGAIRACEELERYFMLGKVLSNEDCMRILKVYKELLIERYNEVNSS